MFSPCVKAEVVYCDILSDFNWPYPKKWFRSISVRKNAMLVINSNSNALSKYWFYASNFINSFYSGWANKGSKIVSVKYTCFTMQHIFKDSYLNQFSSKMFLIFVGTSMTTSWPSVLLLLCCVCGILATTHLKLI